MAGLAKILGEQLSNRHTANSSPSHSSYLLNSDYVTDHPFISGTQASNTMAVVREKTAGEYGRLEQCFYDHLEAPFRLRDHLAQLHGSCQETGPDGLISQPGLLAASLTQNNISVETFDNIDALVDDFLDSPPDCSLNAPILWPSRPALEELRLKMHAFDLGSSPARDIQHYLSEVAAKRDCDIVDQWLPLSPVRADKDQALSFPPQCGRLQSLLRRELQRESIAVSEEAKVFESEVNESLLVAMQESPSTPVALGLRRQSFKGLAEPVTPPLSPVSDDDDIPFVPGTTVTFIDLTSAPSSPADSRFELLKRQVQEGILDSDPPPPSSMSSNSPSSGKSACPSFTRVNPRDLKVDLPVVLTSSCAAGDDDVLSGPGILLDADLDDSQASLDYHDTHFEDAFQALLEDRRTNTRRLSEQERLNTADSISRVPVPVLEFSIEEPLWTTQASSPQAQFLWLMNSMPAVFSFPQSTGDSRLERTLKWSPVPSQEGRISMSEKLPPLGKTSSQLLSMGAVPALISANFIAIRSPMAILRSAEDEELESLEDERSLDAANDQSPPNMTSAKENRLGVDLLKGTQLRKRSSEKQLDETSCLLPMLNEPSATNRLLSGFMELRAVKRPRLAPAAVHLPGSTTQTLNTPQLLTSSSTANRELAPETIRIPYLAPAPANDIPSNKGRFVVSIGLGRTLLRCLEKSWPDDHLIDRDFSRHNTMTWSPGTAVPKETISPLTVEADISLTPAVGVVITSLLKVKQKPLPGSAAQTPLRERVQKVSRKYESLIVLVSDSNTGGDLTGNLSSGDVSAYADFACLSTALEGQVTTYLVRGAEEMISRWLVFLMCRHTPEAIRSKRFLSPQETTWEVFLRRAGMNVTAAQALSGVLFEEAGAQGLARFLTMSAQERVVSYGKLLGGSKILLQSSLHLDQQWA